MWPWTSGPPSLFTRSLKHSQAVRQADAHGEAPHAWAFQQQETNPLIAKAKAGLAARPRGRSEPKGDAAEPQRGQSQAAPFSCSPTLPRLPLPGRLLASRSVALRPPSPVLRAPPHVAQATEVCTVSAPKTQRRESQGAHRKAGSGQVPPPAAGGSGPGGRASVRSRGICGRSRFRPQKEASAARGG